VQLAIATGAGLMTGLSRFPDPLSVAVAILAGGIVLGQPKRLAVAVAASLAIALGCVQRESGSLHCARLLPLGERQFVLETIDPGEDEGRVRLVKPSCAGRLSARWPSGSAVPAGVLATVTARWRPRSAPLGRPEGTLSIRVVHGSVGEPGMVARSRTAAANAIRRRFGGAAPLVGALLIGRRGALDPGVVDAFAAAGLVHLLAISGFHVGLMAAWLVLLGGVLGLPRRQVVPLAAAAALGYAAWLGWPPPATRAAVLVALLAISRWRQRSVGKTGLLGASAVVVMVIDPWAITRLGAWLSFAAVGGVIWATRWSPSLTPRWPWLRDSLSASLGATLATAPIVAFGFGRVAIVGPLLNLVAMPLVALAIPAAGIGMLLDRLAPMVAIGFAEATGLLLRVLGWIAMMGAGLPRVVPAAQPGPASAIPWLALLVVALVATRGGASAAVALRRGGWGVALILLAALMVGPRPVSRGEGRLTLHFLDVGQGDAIAIESPRGRWVVVDGGPADIRWNAGERVVLPWLRRQGVKRLEALVVSHPHRDHVGGVVALVDELPVGVVLDPGEPFREQGYLDLLSVLGGRGIRWHPLIAGDEWRLDGVAFRVVHPGADWSERGIDPNEDSVVLEVRFGEFSALLTGDAGTVAESSYVRRLPAVDLVKVGHHGSRSSTGELLLDALEPVAAVLSSGRNRYGHPAAEVLERLKRHGVALWRTDHEGHVSVATDGRTFTVRGGRSVATFDADELNREEPPCCTKPR
jgi:competence protein ComEC